MMVLPMVTAVTCPCALTVATDGLLLFQVNAVDCPGDSDTVALSNCVCPMPSESCVKVVPAGIRLRPWHLRYAPPSELDAMAERAGLTLAWRHADWDAAPFGDDAGVHVSAYHRGNVRHVLPPGSE